MHSESLNATEAYSASKATHPRVSLDDMKAKIAGQHYFTADQGVTTAENTVSYEGDPLRLLTICILVMRNGFTVIGKSAPASPENFDPEKGKLFAYEDAIKQLWPLEGYALRERLSA